MLDQKEKLLTEYKLIYYKYLKSIDLKINDY